MQEVQTKIQLQVGPDNKGESILKHNMLKNASTDIHHFAADAKAASMSAPNLQPFYWG